MRYCIWISQKRVKPVSVGARSRRRTEKSIRSPTEWFSGLPWKFLDILEIFSKTTEIPISSYFLSKVQKCPENEHIRNIQTNQISLNWDLRSGSNGCRFDWIFRCDFSCEDFLADSAWSGALDFKKYGFTVMLSVQANQKCRRSSFTSLSDRHCLIYLFRYNRRPYNTQLFHRYLGMRVLKWCQLDWFPIIFTKHNNKWSSDNFFCFFFCFRKLCAQ